MPGWMLEKEPIKQALKEGNIEPIEFTNCYDTQKQLKTAKILRRTYHAACLHDTENKDACSAEIYFGVRELQLNNMLDNKCKGRNRGD